MSVDEEREPFAAYHDLSRYPLDPEQRARLLAEQIECTLTWSTADGWPTGVIHWFVWRDDRFWVTTAPDRERVEELRADSRSSIIVSGVGTDLGHGRTVTAKTRATVHEGADRPDWFFPALAAKTQPPGRQREEFEAMLASTPRVVIELEPVRWVSFDAQKMVATQQGRAGE